MPKVRVRCAKGGGRVLKSYQYARSFVKGSDATKDSLEEFYLRVSIVLCTELL